MPWCMLIGEPAVNKENNEPYIRAHSDAVLRELGRDFSQPVLSNQGGSKVAGMRLCSHGLNIGRGIV
jgi:hypothetical protein